MKTSAPIPKEFKLLDRYWKAANYLSVGQIYLLDKNPLLEEKLKPEHVKKRLLGHFGTTPGQNFIYVHLNRLIRERELQMLYVAGPGHGGPAIVANVYLEGTYTKYYPEITMDKSGIGKLFKQFSFPGGIPSHVAPDTPGSIHEGGELGYSLSHSYGAVLDKPDLIVACVVGDGEAETGPLATSWHANKFLNPVNDGTVLPILHLNGYKIANPSILARIPEDELKSLFAGYGYEPIIVSGSDPAKMHPRFAEALDMCADKIAAIQQTARSGNGVVLDQRPTWPMIILRTPKGWTGPESIDNEKIEDCFKSHQVPLTSPTESRRHMQILEDWLMSYEPNKQFDENGKLLPELQAIAPPPYLCMGNNPYTNPQVRPLHLPSFIDYGVTVDPNKRGKAIVSDMKTFASFLRDVFVLNEDNSSFRMFSPDETNSNRLKAVFEATKRQFVGEMLEYDEDSGHYGRVMEMLSEHQCEGWLEGYLLTGGHGLINSYEAFIHIISSMFNQHAKWLEACNKIGWRNEIASLNILLSSHVWRQDHNGFTHQDPGFLQHVATKKPDIVRIYLPPDANCLLSTMHHCLGTKQYVNVVVSGKHPSPQWLTPEDAQEHCASGVGIWPWASNDTNGLEPHIVIACAGDVPTLEALAAVSILRRRMSTLRLRFVNIVDLMKLSSNHPHGLSDTVFDSIFTKGKPVLFNFHAYPQMIEKLVYFRTNRNFIVRGYIEEGTITTPFDMTVLNKVDRFHLVQDVCDIVLGLPDGIVDSQIRSQAPYIRQEMHRKLVRHKAYIEELGEDMDEVESWKWEE